MVRFPNLKLQVHKPFQGRFADPGALQERAPKASQSWSEPSPMSLSRRGSWGTVRSNFTAEIARVVTEILLEVAGAALSFRGVNQKRRIEP